MSDHKKFNIIFLFIFSCLLFSFLGQEIQSQNIQTKNQTIAQSFGIDSPDSIEKQEPKQTILMIITAYSSTEDQTDSTPFITANGSYVEDGIVANNLLPFGTKVRIPELYGTKVFTVEDRMNSRKGYYHVDIWFPTTWQAKEFGVKKTYIEVLEG